MKSSILLKGTIKYPFRVMEVPLLSRLYRTAYDNQKLSNLKITYDFRNPTKILSRLLLPKFYRVGEFVFIDKTCHFDSRNTQFHSIYFNRFTSSGYEPEVCYVIKRIVNKEKTKKPVFYDIGANWGFFVGYFSSISDGDIHAFEPQKLAYSNLRTFIEEAGLKNVRSYNYALGEKNTVGEIKLPDGFHSGLAQINQTESGSIPIRQIDGIRITSPDIVKIDTEGYCFKILTGAIKTIGKSRPYIIFEHESTTKIEISNYFQRLNYDLYTLSVLKIKRNHNNFLTTIKLCKDNRLEKASKNIFAIPREKFGIFLS